MLGDKIGIVAKGRLQCIGSALHLKQKYGAGYRITVGTQENRVKDVQAFFEENLKGAKLAALPISGYLNFAVSREANEQLIPFFQLLETKSSELGIQDCQLSITTLEQVFLKIAESSEMSKYEKETDELTGER